MAWPPPTLPINRTNALDQQDTHPADHNAANQAINDIVAHVTNDQVWSDIGGVNNWTNNYGFQIIAASAALTTDVNGGVTINFPQTFQHPPVVVLCNGDATSGLIPAIVGIPTTTYFWVKAIYHDGSIVANTGIRIPYIAVGART
jgi:hypothetical protein